MPVACGGDKDTRISGISREKNPNAVRKNRRYSSPLLLFLVGSEDILNFGLNVVYTMASYAFTT
jgi:hypothetical protein